MYIRVFSLSFSLSFIPFNLLEKVSYQRAFCGYLVILCCHSG